MTWFGLTGGLPLWAAALCNAMLLYFSAHINHEAVHSNINGAHSNLKMVNEFVGNFGSFWLFLPFPAFRAVHLAHHRTPNHPTLDGDMWFARRTALGVFLSCCTLLYGYEIRLHRLARLGFVTPRAMSSIYLQRAVAIGVVVAAFALGFGPEIFMLWILPALIVMPVLAFMFAYIVHHPHGSEDRYKNSNIWLSKNPFIQKMLTTVFLFQNYHLVHHLHPRIPFYRYAAVFNEIRPRLENEGAPIRYVKLS